MKEDKWKEAVEKLEEVTGNFTEFEKEAENNDEKNKNLEEKLEKTASKTELEEIKKTLDEVKELLENKTSELWGRLTKVENHKESKQVKDEIKKTEKKDVFDWVLY